MLLEETLNAYRMNRISLFSFSFEKLCNNEKCACALHFVASTRCYDYFNNNVCCSTSHIQLSAALVATPHSYGVRVHTFSLIWIILSLWITCARSHIVFTTTCFFFSLTLLRSPVRSLDADIATNLIAHTNTAHTAIPFHSPNTSNECRRMCNWGTNWKCEW